MCGVPGYTPDPRLADVSTRPSWAGFLIHRVDRHAHGFPITAVAVVRAHLCGGVSIGDAATYGLLAISSGPPVPCPEPSRKQGGTTRNQLGWFRLGSGMGGPELMAISA